VNDCKEVVGAMEQHDCRCHNECCQVHVHHSAACAPEKKVAVNKLQEHAHSQPPAQEEKAMRRLSEPPADRRASLRSLKVKKRRTRSGSPTHREKQALARKLGRKHFVDARRQAIADGFQLHEKEKLQKAKAMKAAAKQKQKQTQKQKLAAPKRRKSNHIAEPTDVAAKRNARNVRRARCRHNAEAGACMFGVLKLPAEERRLFSWIGPNHITMLPLDNNVSDEQRVKKQRLLDELRRMGAVQRESHHWISRKVAVKAKPKLRAKLTQLVNRYRAMYNALVSILNGDSSVTFKKLSEMTLADGLHKLLAALQRISTAEVGALQQERDLLLAVKFKLEHLLNSMNYYTVFVFY